MARMEINGIDGLMDNLAELALLPDNMAEDVLNAEADVLVPAQRAEIQARWRGPYSQGISAKAVKKGSVKRSGNGHSISICPKGSRKRGRKRVRNADIAFINEYGAPGRGIVPRPAIGTANARTEQRAVEAGERVYHTYLNSKNF